MLGDNEAIATIAVKDINAAKRFYEQTLGLEPIRSDGGEGVTLYRSGSSKVLVYQSAFAGTNKATVANWIVGDVDGTAKALKAKGVSFEHYDFPDLKREGDVHVAGDLRIAWFKDPDENILSLISR